MERMKASDFPQELLDLFHLYVHGDIDRRGFFEGAGKFAVGGLTVAGLFEALKPNYAWAQQIAKDDNRIRTEYATVPSPQGNGSIKGYLVRPAAAGKYPAVLVVHENRGLNPYIEDVARRLGTANFIAFAPDGLTSVGGYPGNDEQGGQLFRKSRSREDDRRLHRGRQLGEIAPGEHRSLRRCRILFWWRDLEHAGGADARSRRGRSVLRRRAGCRGRPEDQGGRPRPPRRARSAACGGVAGVRSGAESRTSSGTKATCIPKRTTDSTTTRPHDMTRPPRSRRGSARSIGSIDTCVPDLGCGFP